LRFWLRFWLWLRLLWFRLRFRFFWSLLFFLFLWFLYRLFWSLFFTFIWALCIFWCVFLFIFFFESFIVFNFFLFFQCFSSFFQVLAQVLALAHAPLVQAQVQVLLESPLLPLPLFPLHALLESLLHLYLGSLYLLERLPLYFLLRKFYRL